MELLTALRPDQMFGISLLATIVSGFLAYYYRREEYAPIAFGLLSAVLAVASIRLMLASIQQMDLETALVTAALAGMIFVVALVFLAYYPSIEAKITAGITILISFPVCWAAANVATTLFFQGLTNYRPY